MRVPFISTVDWTGHGIFHPHYIDHCFNSLSTTTGPMAEWLRVDDNIIAAILCLHNIHIVDRMQRTALSSSLLVMNRVQAYRYGDINTIIFNEEINNPELNRNEADWRWYCARPPLLWPKWLTRLYKEGEKLYGPGGAKNSVKYTALYSLIECLYYLLYKQHLVERVDRLELLIEESGRRAFDYGPFEYMLYWEHVPVEYRPLFKRFRLI